MTESIEAGIYEHFEVVVRLNEPHISFARAEHERGGRVGNTPADRDPAAFGTITFVETDFIGLEEPARLLRKSQFSEKLDVRVIEAQALKMGGVVKSTRRVPKASIESAPVYD